MDPPQAAPFVGTSTAIEVSVADLAVLAPVYPECHALLTFAEQCRAARYARPEPREEFVLCRALLRMLLSARCGVAPQEVAITAGLHGKPEAAGVHFSVSHSHGLAVIAIAGLPVGIDLERIDPHLDWTELAGEVDLPPAVCFAQNCPAARRKFYQAWTRREALAKCSGAGIGHDREPRSMRHATVLSVCELVLPVPYVGTLACAGTITASHMKHVRAGDVHEQLLAASACFVAESANSRPEVSLPTS